MKELFAALLPDLLALLQALLGALATFAVARLTQWLHEHVKNKTAQTALDKIVFVSQQIVTEVGSTVIDRARAQDGKVPEEIGKLAKKAAVDAVMKIAKKEIGQLASGVEAQNALASAIVESVVVQSKQTSPFLPIAGDDQPTD